MPKIYTKVGDRGQTQLVGGQKAPKNDLRIDGYGNIDELNSVLGFVRSEIKVQTLRSAKGEMPGNIIESLNRLDRDLEVVQHWLFDLGSLVACLPVDRDKFNLPTIASDHVAFLEERIDAATAVLAALKNFILPGGSELAARFHLARTVARRAERGLISVAADLPENAIPFVNRLSDYLFIMARLSNHLLSVADVVWQKTAPPPRG